jgi:1,4-alpha-glucan branching enzyme
MQNTSVVIGQMDEHLFHEGKHVNAYNFMGAHRVIDNGVSGIRFTTWAPNASRICVIGDFDYWQFKPEYYMTRISHGGLWSVFIPNVTDGMKYKFAVTNQWTNNTVYKADPYARQAEVRPNTASVISTVSSFKWNDHKWLDNRANTDIFSQPMNIYELHLGSWKTRDDRFLTYDELSTMLPEYVKYMGYTHVELMPLNEHPLDASWGYQATGYFAVNSRHGSPDGLKRLIDALHRANIGVILDWVPGHFCKDEQGLINFDGTACYEYQDYWRANNKGWGTHNFDLGRHEVKCFLISNAMYWLNEFHIDGLRVDAVSSILYLDYGREHGEWQQNIYGNNQNLEAINFLKEFNWVIKNNCKGAITIAEESTAWPKITTPVEYGGLGFDLKWNMGWMNDTLRYVALDPIYRKYHHNQMNFSMLYHYSEKFVLPISHDEVVHGKKSLIGKMWGDLWNKFAGLRLYATYMIGHPGKKLLFMGSEFGQFVEWREYEELQWHIIDKYNTHKETLTFFKHLNHFYKAHSALWERDYDPSGFQWIDADNADQSILSFVRYSHDESLVFIFNFTPMLYNDYRLGVPNAGSYQQIFNSDNMEFGGSGQIMGDKAFSFPEWSHGFPQHIVIKVPPMAAIVLKRCD